MQHHCQRIRGPRNADRISIKPGFCRMIPIMKKRARLATPPLSHRQLLQALKASHRLDKAAAKTKSIAHREARLALSAARRLERAAARTKSVTERKSLKDAAKVCGHFHGVWLKID